MMFFSTKARLAFVLLLFVWGVHGAAQTNNAAAARPGISIASDAGNYRVGPGDEFEVSVLGAPELTTLARVDQQGAVQLPLIGGLRVGGESVDTVRLQIAQQLQSQGWLVNPDVSVFLVAAISQKIVVGGAVLHPLTLETTTPIDLQQALADAGGVDPKYAGTSVSVVRGRTGKMAGVANLTTTLAEARRSDITLYPGDQATVSSAGVVYVLGDVNRPGGFLLSDYPRLSLLQALALSQGLGPNASEKLTILHGGRADQTTTVNVAAVLRRHSANPILDPNDVVYVPTNTTRAALRRALDTTIATLSGVTVYRAAK